MASILKFLKTIRNHWKKSTFAGCAIAYGGNYAKESFEIQNLMEEYCKEATKYGMQPLQSTENPRKVLVILNPTANRRKAIKQFEQYCVPILHLAGICVDVIQTKSEGHARTIVEELKEKTDAIVIAGGDGTLSESVTGILRRGDNYAETCPIGILPLGRENTFAQSLFSDTRGEGTLGHVRRLATASMAIVKDHTKQTNVIKIETEMEGNKPVFALSSVEWGSYRDAHSKLDKYWYFGAFRKYATYIFNGYKSSLNWNCCADITYSPPCTGCSNCYKELQMGQERAQLTAQQQQNGRWWGTFVPKTGSKYHEHEFLINEQCATTQNKHVETTDFNLNVGNSELIVNWGPDGSNITYLDFVSEGCKSENGAKRTINDTINARQIHIQPKEPTEGHFYSIDHEDFEVKPIKITLLPKIIKIFCFNSV